MSAAVQLSLICWWVDWLGGGKYGFIQIAERETRDDYFVSSTILYCNSTDFSIYCNYCSCNRQPSVIFCPNCLYSQKTHDGQQHGQQCLNRMSHDNSSFLVDWCSFLQNLLFKRFSEIKATIFFLDLWKSTGLHPGQLLARDLYTMASG